MTSAHRISGTPIEELIVVDLDQALTPQEAAALTAHLESCAACRRLAEQHQRLHAELAGQPALPTLERDRERIWAAINARRAARQPRWPVAALGRVAIAAAVLLGAAVIGAVLADRTRVAAPAVPTRTVAQSDFPLPDGGSGTLTIRQGGAFARPGERTGVEARMRLVFPVPQRLGTAEIRFQAPGDLTYGVLARAPDLAGVERLDAGGAFPRPAGTEAVRYEVWVHIETSAGTIDTAPLRIEVVPLRSGEEARAP